MSDDKITLDGHDVSLSHLDRVLFPDAVITKGDLVDYYRRIANVALPHYRDRPVTMRRFPDGIDGEGFFQKNMPDYFPDWIGRVELSKEDGTVTHVLANDAASLVYIANQGCITLHLGLCRKDKPNHPDRLIFDLDPSDDDFGKVQEAARIVKAFLEGLGLVPFVKTTGSRGLHVVVPLDRAADFDTARAFARDAAAEMAESHGTLLTVEQRKNKRGDRVFVDYMRNAYGQTAVAPYSVRAIEGAPVATPLRWSEAFSSDRGPRKYTIANLFRRLAQVEDPWRSMDDEACALDKSRKSFG